MNHPLKYFKSAFTMIELVFVIIVIGILSALALSRMERDLRQEAADNILSDIRYTQHLALMGSKQKFDKAKWQQRYWRIVFGTCSGNNRFYMIGTDDSMSSSTNALFSRNEAAIDPANGKPMFWTNGTDCSSGGDGTVSERIFISKRYGITNVTPSGGCSTTSNTKGYIGFDHLGRAQYGFSQSSQPDNTGYISTACTFTFTLSDGDNFKITIQPETGYAQIVDQNAS